MIHVSYVVTFNSFFVSLSLYTVMYIKEFLYIVMTNVSFIEIGKFKLRWWEFSNYVTPGTLRTCLSGEGQMRRQMRTNFPSRIKKTLCLSPLPQTPLQIPLPGRLSLPPLPLPLLRGSLVSLHNQNLSGGTKYETKHIINTVSIFNIQKLWGDIGLPRSFKQLICINWNKPKSY